MKLMQPIQCALTMTVMKSFVSATAPSFTWTCARSSITCLSDVMPRISPDARSSRKTWQDTDARGSLVTPQKVTGGRKGGKEETLEIDARETQRHSSWSR